MTSGVIDPLDDGWGGVRPVSQSGPSALRRFCLTGSTHRSTHGSRPTRAQGARCVSDPRDRSDRRCRWSMCAVYAGGSVEACDDPSVWHLAALLTVRSPPLGSSPRQQALRCRQVPSEFRPRRSQRFPFRTTSRHGISLRKRLATEMSPRARACFRPAVDDDALFAWWWDRMPTGDSVFGSVLLP